MRYFFRVGLLEVVVIVACLVGRTSYLGVKAYLKPKLYSSRELVVLIFVLRGSSLGSLLLSIGIFLHLHLLARVLAALFLDLLGLFSTIAPILHIMFLCFFRNVLLLFFMRRILLGYFFEESACLLLICVVENIFLYILC